MKRWLSLILSLSLLLPFTSCAPAPSQKFQKTILGCFDTVTTVVGFAKSREAFDEVAGEIESELERYHALFSIYDDVAEGNNLKALNDKRRIIASDELIEFLDYGILMQEKTNGRMNIAMGAVLSLWHEARTEGTLTPQNAKLPDRAALEAAALHCDINSIAINRETNEVSLTDDKTLLDVGALGKGYAVEKVAEKLLSRGISGYLINAGGNVKTVGTRGDGTPWTVGIEDPNSEDLLATLSLSDKALVTSGSYMRYYFVGGKKYHHIISPDTLMPSEGIVSLSVLADSSAEADALSTALFTLSYEEGLALLDHFPSVEVLWLLSDGSCKATDGFAAYRA